MDARNTPGSSPGTSPGAAMTVGGRRGRFLFSSWPAPGSSPGGPGHPRLAASRCGPGAQSRWRDVGARNKSGHDDVGGEHDGVGAAAGGRSAVPFSLLVVAGPRIRCGGGHDGGGCRRGLWLALLWEPRFDSIFRSPLESKPCSTGEPGAVRHVACDAAGFLPGLPFPEAGPSVMPAERTFREKATAIHVHCRGERRRGGPGAGRPRPGAVGRTPQGDVLSGEGCRGRPDRRRVADGPHHDAAY